MSDATTLPPILSQTKSVFIIGPFLATFFFIFYFSIQLPIRGFELRICNVGIDCSTNSYYPQNKKDIDLSVIRLGDLLDFGKVFKAFDNN